MITDTNSRSNRLSKCPRSQAEIESFFVHQIRFSMCRRPYPRTESSSGLRSRSLTFHSRRLWRNWQRSRGFSSRTKFNSVLWSRPLTLATSLVEMIVEVTVIRTQEKTQQVTTTQVQHVVNTVEVVRPQIIKQTVQKSTIQENINQVTKHIEVPQFLNKIPDMPVVVQRQVSMAQKAMKAPQMQVVEKTVEGPQLQIVAKTAKTPRDPKRSGTLRPQRVWVLCLNASGHRRCGGGQDRSSFSYRIRITHARLDACIGNSSSC